MWFGLKTLPNVHSGHLFHKTKLSLIPRRLLQNNTLSSKKPTNQDLLRVKAGDLESTRPLTYFPPSAWEDHFLSVPVDDYVTAHVNLMCFVINTLSLILSFIVLFVEI